MIPGRIDGAEGRFLGADCLFRLKEAVALILGDFAINEKMAMLFPAIKTAN
jgi:hypothetical protein